MFLRPNLNDSFINQKQQLSQNQLLLTDSSYCMIAVERDMIRCSFFLYIEIKDCYCQINFSALSSNLLFDLICKHYNLCNYISFYHILYIGKEIYKAELAKTFQQTYRQS